MFRRVGIVFLVFLASLAQACPTCKDALNNTPATAGLSRGFYYSIILMLGVVFGLVGILIYKIVQEARQQPVKPTA